MPGQPCGRYGTGFFLENSLFGGGVDQITAKQLLLVPGEGLEKIVGPTGGLQPVANVLPAGLRAVETLTGQQFDKAVSFCGLAFF